MMNGSEIIKKETMTSLEIAEITGKEHKHVMRDIRVLLEQGVSQSNFGLTSYKQEQPNGGTRDVPMYRFVRKAIAKYGKYCGTYEPIIESIANVQESLRCKKLSLADGTDVVSGVFSCCTKLDKDGKENLALARVGLIINELPSEEGENIVVEKFTEGELLTLIQNLMSTYSDLRKLNARLRDIGITEDDGCYDD